MLKFIGRRGKVRILGLGLEAGNVMRLMEGKPIHVRGKDLGLDNVEVMIFYGSTTAQMVHDLEEAGVKLPKARTP